jgi:hypothetical protein
MRINQIISEDFGLDEAPFGLASKLGNKIASKLGSKSAKARLDVGGDANAMKKDLAVWMSGSGIAKGQLELDDFKSFLDQKGLPTAGVDAILNKIRMDRDGVDNGGPLTNPDVDNILKKVVQQGFKGQGAKGRQSRFAATPAGGGGGTGGALPANITSALSTLTPAQKAALKGML